MEILRTIYYSILKILPTKWVVNIENLRTYGKFVNTKNPEYYGEKIQCLKLNGKLKKYSDFVDKYKVRKYVKEKVGEEYLIPLIEVFEKPEEINYNKLPNSFVLKLNHGSGYNIIVKDKSKLDINKTNKQLNKWLKEDYYKIKKENQYQNVVKKIICEKYIADKNGELNDYKFFCFDGKPEFFKVDFGRYENHTMNYYDLDMNLLNLQEGNFKNNTEKIERVKNLNEMIDISKKLSEDFQFVRVDLYNVDGKIFFGELTFTPASGKHKFIPLWEDKKIAKKIKV